ncbi:MAG TPA: hypothetical protein DEP66_02505, partial [Acidimicrobiaceae bacterium]|nr:hypothetical protein [Acidimicrobiaceae bacterium]
AGAVDIARIAREFAGYGLAPRHLRIIRNAAARDAEMLLQGLQPVMHAAGPTARVDAARATERLLLLCERLRSAVMRDAMSHVLD